MMRCAALLLTAFLSSAASAQSVDVIVRGIVRDQTGAILPGVTISASHRDTRLARFATSADEGTYSLPPIPPGVYEVKAVLAGFRPHVRTEQNFHVGTTVTIDFTLVPEGVTETVAVVANAPALETTKNTLSRLVAREEIDALPVVSRNFNELAALAPGVTATGVYGGVDISGSRDFQNGYNVDGTSSEGLGLGEQRIAYAQDWIQEFQVLTNQYAAEFGGASGGVVNVITRSGSNTLEGRVYTFFRDDDWDATPAFAPTKPPLSIVRGGATLGGKLIADRLFFFGGVEAFTDRSSSIVNSAFPAVNGSVPSRRDQWLYLGKLEHHPSAASSHRLRFHAFRDRRTGANVGGTATEEHGRTTRYDSRDVSGSWTRVVSGTLFNELRAAFNATKFGSQCNFAARHPAGTWFERRYPGGLFGCPANYGQNAWRELQILDNVSWNRGAHHVKAGIQLSRARSSGDVRNLRDGIYTFPVDVPFDLANPASYPSIFTIFSGSTAWGYSWWSGGAFAQDSWRVGDRLTVNIGVRYDLDGAFTALNPIVRVDKGMMRIAIDRNNVSPRAGLAWTPFNNQRRTLLRAGAGMYYDQNHSNIAFVMLQNNILVERAFTLNAFSPGLNPFWPDSARARRVLAEALARNTIPDFASLPGSIGGTPDLERNLQIPRTAQISGGAAHDFGKTLTMSADVIYSRGTDQYIIRDVNYDRSAALEGRVVRPNPAYSFINRYGNGGWFRYRALHLQASLIPGLRYFAKLSYTWAQNDGNTNTALSGIGGTAEPANATNPFDYSEDEGPSSHDVRHVLSVDGVTTLPLGVQLAGILSARSALPYSATTPRQLDPDPFADRFEPRNSRRGDRFFSLDLRLSKTIPLGNGRSLTVLGEVFNATNATNLFGYVGVVEAVQFGRPTAAHEKRRTQLGIRVDF